MLTRLDSKFNSSRIATGYGWGDLQSVRSPGTGVERTGGARIPVGGKKRVRDFELLALRVQVPLSPLF